MLLGPENTPLNLLRKKSTTILENSVGDRRDKMTTPWGKIQHSEKVATGVTIVDTASHGGYRISPSRYASMNPALKELGFKYGNYYYFEEDCDWCAVVIAFSELFEAKNLQSALDTFKQTHYKQYEKYCNVTLKEGESRSKDVAMFWEKNKNKFVVSSAMYWDKENKIVKVCAKKSTSPYANQNEEKWFLIPAEEYKTKYNNPAGAYVIENPNDFEETTPGFQKC